MERIKKLFDLGVDRAILGTAAVENLELLKSACEKFSNKIVLSLDVRKGYIALYGWKKQTNILASDFVKRINNIGVSRIIYTDIDRDGTKLGPNIEETLNLSKTTKIPVVISGGVSSIKDVINIKKNKFQNIEGVIIGKAIYDGNISVTELSELI